MSLSYARDTARSALDGRDDTGGTASRGDFHASPRPWLGWKYVVLPPRSVSVGLQPILRRHPGVSDRLLQSVLGNNQGIIGVPPIAAGLGQAADFEDRGAGVAARDQRCNRPQNQCRVAATD